jgi:PadR family transcriptional regulator PadR
MKIETQLLRGAGPLAVLKVLRRRRMYGYELVQALDEQTAGVLGLGQSTLYPLLYNLEAKGLIASEWETADSGRDRKYYRLTDKGSSRLAKDEKQWAALVEAMAALGVARVMRLVPAMVGGAA